MTTPFLMFKPWPKTPRLFRDTVITEKIDGTNAAVCIVPTDDGVDWLPSEAIIVPHREHGDVLVYAQSRKRIITPGNSTDNAGFAGWVWDNAESLVTDLGPGHHHGEWWGPGIQRGYDVHCKRFSLFNVARYDGLDFVTPWLLTVPVLHEGIFDTGQVRDALYDLAVNGSKAAPGFMRPEGVVVYHSASSQIFKALIDSDQSAKSDLVAVRPAA